MTGFPPNGKLRAMTALIAAYALALQAVFTMLAPMQVQADGTIAIYCSGSGSAASQGSNDPATPVSAPGKMQCVFCGACAAGAVILPDAATPAYGTIERSIALGREASQTRLAEHYVRDGPARAPPLTV